MKFPHGEGSAVIHCKKNDLLYKDATLCVIASGNVISLVNRSQTGSRSPRVSPHYCFAGGVKFPHGEGSAVIHRRKNYLLYKDATCLCHSLCQSEFTCHRKQVVNRLKTVSYTHLTLPTMAVV